MKSAEFYKVLRRTLAPALKSAGFGPATGGTFFWTAPVDSGFIRFSVIGSKHGWSEPFGSHFYVSISVADKPSRSWSEYVKGAGRLDDLDFMEEAALIEFRTIRNSVIDKGLCRTLVGLPAAIDSAVTREDRELEKCDFPVPGMPVEFPWLDAEDIARWGEYWSRIVDGIVPKVRELLSLTPNERRGITVRRWRSADTRSDAERAAHRAKKAAARKRSVESMSAIGSALDQSRSS